jgi:hypothetical protein
MSYQTDHVKWLTAGGAGMPGPAELTEALLHICAHIGAGANAVAATVNAWNDGNPTYAMPGPAELAHVLDALRTLVGDTEANYTIDWHNIDTLAQAGSYPGSRELGELLVAIDASV